MKLPEGWERRALGDVIELAYGKPLSAEDRSEDGVYPAYGANGVKDRTNRFLCDEASIVVGRKGSAGEITLTEDRFWPLDVTYYVVFDRSRYEIRFLYYLLTTLDLPSLAKGVKPGLNRNEVYAIQCDFPPLPEQRRIVAILDEAFEAIATAKVNTERNLQSAREVFESELHRLFTQNGADWSKKTLREVAVDFGRGKSKHRPRNDPRLYGGPYPFIQTGDVRNAGHHITEHTQTYSDVGLAQSKLWPKGTLCITIAANIAETGVLNFEACFPDSVIGVVVDERQTTSKYLEYMLQTVKADLKAKGKGSAQNNINMATFETERFPFPDLNEQIKIVSRLDRLVEDVDRLATTYTAKLTDLDELKQSLLHQAFTGQLTENRAAEGNSLPGTSDRCGGRISTFIPLRRDRMLRRNVDQIHLQPRQDSETTIEVSSDDLYAAGVTVAEVIGPMLARRAKAAPSLRATIYIHSTSSVNFHEPGYSDFLVVVGPALVANAIGSLLSLHYDIRHRISEAVSRHHGVPFLHIEDGLCWQIEDASTWFSNGDDPQESMADSAESGGALDGPYGAGRSDGATLPDGDLEMDDPIDAAKVDTEDRRGRLRAARSDATIGTIRQTIEELFGLPAGAVRLCGPDGKPLRGDATIGTLRGRWE